MANVDAAFGLKPVRHLNGSPWNGATIRCHAPAAYGGSALYVGDPVMLEATTATRSTTTVTKKPCVADYTGLFSTYNIYTISHAPPTHANS